MTENTPSPSQKERIFISYRRVDSEGYAGRIYDRLVLHFGDDAIFMDVDDIPAGVDFVEYLENEVQSCDVLIALIGKQWLDVKDERGIRRLDNPNDFVRIEIATALKRDIRVIPVLLGGAQMPNVSDLPENLQSLTRRNGLLVYHHSFHADTTRLIKHLENALGIAEKERQRIAKEKADLEAAKKAAKEKVEKDAAEKDRLEAEEKERQRIAKEKADRETAEKAAREKADREAAEKLAREKAEREAELKKMESQAIQYELRMDFWNARKIWYEIKKIDPLFPRVDLKIRELEREVGALLIREKRESYEKAELEAEKPHDKQPTQERRISLFVWNLTLLPILLISLIFIGNLQKISDATQGIGGFFVVIPSTITISIIQWFLLRRLFPKSLRWVGLNAVYIIMLSLLAVIFLGGLLANNSDLWLLAIFSFFAVLTFWLIPNYYVGYLISKRNIAVDKFFSEQDVWNISFWIKWISTPILGVTSTIIILILMKYIGDSWLHLNLTPVWLISVLIFGLWGGLTGFFQWLILRDRFKNFRWLIIVYMVTGAIPWGDVYNIVTATVFVFWILLTLISAPILVWKQDKHGKGKLERNINLKPIDARFAIGGILILLGLGLWIVPKYIVHAPTASELSQVNAEATVSSLQVSKIKVFGPDNGEIIHNPGDNVLKFASSGVNLMNFVFEAQINNPLNNDFWSYAIDFRETYQDDALYLTLNSDKTWSLDIDKKGNWNVISNGTLNNLDISPGGSNKVRLIVDKKLAFFYINDKFISTLDVYGNQYQGDVAIVVRNEIAGEKTSYEGFTLWSINSSSP